VGEPFQAWVCGYCRVEIQSLGIPPGWVWQRYRSFRDDRETSALGCCLDHARLAAEKLGVPEGGP
jgi:hypothetical protein